MTFVDPFQAVVVRHPSSTLELHVLPYGLTTHRLLLHAETQIVDAQQQQQQQVTAPKVPVHDLLVGPEDAEGHWKHGRAFFGPVVGRYANRLPVGETKVAGGVVTWPQWGGEGISHHGGPGAGPSGGPATSLPEIPEGSVPPQSGPFDVLVWTPIPRAASKLFANVSGPAPAGSSAIFALHSAPNADGTGSQSDLRIEARFAVLPPDGAEPPLAGLGRSAGSVRVEYRAKVLRGADEAATPLNITQHWALNLSVSSRAAREAEGGRIDEHTLRFLPGEGGSIYTLELDDKGVPTGGLLAAEGPHDFTAPSGAGRTMGSSAPQGGHDHFYCWGAASTSEVRAILASQSTKLAVCFRTNQSGTQLYTANGQPEAPASSTAGGARKYLHGGDEGENDGNARRSGAFLEFAHPHATFLHESLQKLAGSDTLLRSGETYSNFVEAEVWEG